MSVKSFFEFKFSADTINEGLPLATAIGNDMPSKEGYLGHEVIQDVSDPNHLMVNTHWSDRQKAEAVLTKYNNDAKITRAKELLGNGPTGFIGEILE
ncbi:antibiotic biosynthesis monooxygenase family protein [Mucilaginibacter sp.]